MNKKENQKLKFNYNKNNIWNNYSNIEQKYENEKI